MELSTDKKKCKQCKKEKILNEFSTRIRKTGKVYINLNCKQCEKLRKNKWYNENKEKASKNRKDWRKNNSERKKFTDKKWRETNLEKIKEKEKKYREKNKKKIKQRVKKYQKEHYNEHLIKYRKTKSSWTKRRRKEDEKFRISQNIRCRIYKALKSQNTIKSIKTLDLLGCSIDFFKKWLEWQFNSKMDWENHGFYWQIDHVIPCSSFNLVDKEKQYKCFNWKNCRPLEKSKNNKKRDKIIQSDILIQELKVFTYKK